MFDCENCENCTAKCGRKFKCGFMIDDGGTTIYKAGEE